MTRWAARSMVTAPRSPRSPAACGPGRPRARWSRPLTRSPSWNCSTARGPNSASAIRARNARTGDPMYFTDRGIEELESRRGDEEVSLAWLAERLRSFVDLNPDFEVAVDRLATWLARADDEDD